MNKNALNKIIEELKQVNKEIAELKKLLKKVEKLENEMKMMIKYNKMNKENKDMHYCFSCGKSINDNYDICNKCYHLFLWKMITKQKKGSIHYNELEKE